MNLQIVLVHLADGALLPLVWNLPSNSFVLNYGPIHGLSHRLLHPAKGRNLTLEVDRPVHVCLCPSCPHTGTQETPGLLRSMVSLVGLSAAVLVVYPSQALGDL